MYTTTCTCTLLHVLYIVINQQPIYMYTTTCTCALHVNYCLGNCYNHYTTEMLSIIKPDNVHVLVYLITFGSVSSVATL